MKIDGKVIAVLPLETGEGKNGTWKKQVFAIEYMEGQYEKKAAFTVFGGAVDKLPKLRIGMEVAVSFGVESREHNGRWYSELKAWKVDAVGGSYASGAPSAPTAGGAEIDNDLPF